MTNKTITLKNKPTVLLTKDLQAEITVLHNQCPSGKEWSGLLVYKVVEGDLDAMVNDDPDSKVLIHAEHVFLMDFGDATFTSFEGSEAWIDFFEKHPEVSPTRTDKNNGYYVGKLHSHHSMSAFHSGTDTADLVENAPKLPMFLSLVCNYACNPFAEIAVAYQVEVETKTKEKKSMKIWKWFGADQDEVEEKEEKIVQNGTIIIPCDTRYLATASFIKQIENVTEKARAASYKPTYKPNYYNGHDYDFRGGLSKNHHTQRKEEKKEEKIGSGSTTNNYLDMLNDLPDLILLGNSATNMSVQSSLEAAARQISNQNMDEYTKAFKFYFTDFWYPVVFKDTKVSEVDVLDMLIIWAKQHTAVWVARQIKMACDELKKELTVLRTV